MIYTITLNPSIDYYVRMGRMKSGNVNSVAKAEFFAGGKGVNVSIILSYFGVQSVCLGFLGGPLGKIYSELLSQKNLDLRFTEIADNTRLNVKVRTRKQETDLNAKGPKVTYQELEMFLAELDTVTNRDYVVISGSAPCFEERDFLIRILERIKKTGAKLIVDMAGESLRQCLSFQPYLIKPNEQEFKELIGKKCMSAKSLRKNLLFMQHSTGIQNILLSLGKAGAILVSDNKIQETPAIKTEVIDTVGAGDTMLAGFIYGDVKGYSDERKIRLAAELASVTVGHRHLPKQADFSAIEV